MVIRDENHSEKRGYGSYTTHKTNEGYKWRTGEFVSPKGIVSVYAQKDDKLGNYIGLKFAYNGRVYHRSIFKSKSISDKALSTRANQFVKSLLR